MSTCEHKDCPICMEVISGTNNQVVTECGHAFHTSCLMTNVAHNGFGCPYCRSILAEQPKKDEDEEDDDEWVDDDEEDEELYDDYALRGMRWLFQRTNNEELDEEEDEVEEAIQENDSIPKPSVNFLTQKLLQQGITMEELVKTLLLEHEEYEDVEEECERACDTLFGKVRIIISNYKPEDDLPKDTPASTTPMLTSYYADRFLRVV